jgi:hypothetical protein
MGSVKLKVPDMFIELCTKHSQIASRMSKPMNIGLIFVEETNIFML